MPDDKNICGGITDDGEICTLSAGWGREGQEGPCRHHSDARRPPDKLTPSFIDALDSDLSYGHSFKAAVEANGVSEQRAYQWLGEARELDPDDTSEYAERLRTLLERSTRAAGAGERKLERVIIDDAAGVDSEGGSRNDDLDGKVAAQQLNRKRGGENSQREQNDDLGGRPSPEDLSDDERDAALELLRQRNATPTESSLNQ